jgi:hypothetical protein
MHTKPLSLARKFLLGLATLFGLVLLTGCDMTLTRITPDSLPENPSQIYTITLRATPKARSIIKDSITSFLVIDGQSHKMNKSPMGEDLYEFDYQLPSGRDEMAYYFLVQYQYDTSVRPHSQEMYTEIFHTKIARRYVLSLEVNRGPVGARVNVLGRGFAAQDTVYLDNQPARTVYESPNSISFFIPAVPASRNYKVMLGGTSGNSFVGTLRVDPSNVQVFPTSLTLHGGEVQNLTFTLPYTATAGGLLLDVTTDVPESVIMPEVVVPAGQSSVSVPVQGGKKGSGNLSLKGFGPSGEILVPITVQ